MFNVKIVIPYDLKHMSLSTIQIARYTLSFAWIYHGLFPKILTIAPIEKAMTASLGFGYELSYLITKTAGVGEMIFGLMLFIFYRNKALIWLNIAVLCLLLFYVAIILPTLLFEAFNPVTTNLMMIALSSILLKKHHSVKEHRNL